MHRCRGMQLGTGLGQFRQQVVSNRLFSSCKFLLIRRKHPDQFYVVLKLLSLVENGMSETATSGEGRTTNSRSTTTTRHSRKIIDRADGLGWCMEKQAHEPKLRPTTACQVGLYFLSNSFLTKAAMSFSMLYLLHTQRIRRGRIPGARTLRCVSSTISARINKTDSNSAAIQN